MKDLQGKRILFFAPNSFGYELEIVKELERHGATVELYNERPSNKFIVKALIRLGKKRVRLYTDRYFKKIIGSYKLGFFDYVFVLRGEAMSPTIIQYFRCFFPDAKLILYLWDSIRNNNTLELIPFFDKAFTFDRLDAQTYPELIFRPLFFLPDYCAIANVPFPSRDRILFVGTVHSDRFSFLKKIEISLRNLNFDCDFYFFFQSKLLYFKKKMVDTSFKGLSSKDFSFAPLSKNDLVWKMSNSSVVLDIHHPNQNGLTMRSIETLGANRKLITTNIDILKYDFFDENNVFVISRDFLSKPFDLDSLHQFIVKPFCDIHESVYKRYTIEFWIDELFE